MKAEDRAIVLLTDATVFVYPDGSITVRDIKEKEFEQLEGYGIESKYKENEKKYANITFRSQ